MTLTRKEQKEATKKRILDAARTVYAQQGFGATTSDIAKAAGVAHGSVFVHYPTVEQLAVAVVEDFGDRVGRRLHAMAERNASLAVVLQAHVEVLAEDEALYARIAAAEKQLSRQAWQTFWASQSTASLHICSILEDMQRLGRAKAGPSHLFFNTWMGLLHYYMLNRSLFVRDGGVLEQHGRELVEHFCRLVERDD